MFCPQSNVAAVAAAAIFPVFPAAASQDRFHSTAEQAGCECMRSEVRVFFFVLFREAGDGQRRVKSAVAKM